MHDGLPLDTYLSATCMGKNIQEILKISNMIVASELADPRCVSTHLKNRSRYSSLMSICWY